MPELGYPQSDFIKAVKREAGKMGYAETQLIYGALRLRGEHSRELDEMIGAGGEYVVVPGPQGKREELALAFRYKDKDMTPRRAKSIFYLQRIFSILFPHNFPHFYAAFGRPKAGTVEQTAAPTGQIRERINGFPRGLDHYYSTRHRPYSYALIPDSKIKYHFKDVTEISRREFGFDLHHDVANSNFLLGSDGGEYYVDVLELWDFPEFFRIRTDVVDKIVRYMQENNYDQKEIYIVQKSIERLRELGKGEDGS